MKTIEITEENLLKAFEETCKEGKELLENLFPEAFESGDFDLMKLEIVQGDEIGAIFTDVSAKKAGFNGSAFFQIRTYGAYRHKAFYLDSHYCWKIEAESDNLCLIPTKKC